MICAEYADPELHRHSAAHIMISLEGVLEVVLSEKTVRCEGILIPSGLPHTANSYGKQVLVFLFDNTTDVSGQIDTIRTITNDDVMKIRKAFRDLGSGDRFPSDYKAFIRSVFAQSGICEAGTAITDTRILNALAYIRSGLRETITRTEVAAHVCLSPGRFSHLFREQVGMTFAAYLVYRRVIQTYTDIINGNSVTEAALDAGFSSSAHFAEVNKRMFGLSASAIKKDLRFYKIAEI